MFRRMIAVCGALLGAACSDECFPTAKTVCPLPNAGVAGIANWGTQPSGAHISLDCTPFNVPAFINADCLYSHVRIPPVECTLKMADRTGLVIGASTQVSFMSEAGAISPSATSPAYDPNRATSAQTELGHAVGYLEVFGSPLPADVPPVPGEPSVRVDFGCGLRTANPRDGYVTVIAWLRGEEGYVDVNRNGKYDPGEPFVDLGEPYVDANDNGQWDPGEWFLDANGDGQYTGPNGRWDGDAVIWTQTRVLYSGFPGFAVDATGNLLLSRIYSTGTPPAPTPPPAPFSVAVGGAVSYGVFFTDDRLNPLSSSATYGVASFIGNVTPKLLGPFLTANLLGESFRLLYCASPSLPSSCSDGPVEHACKTVPCYVVPDVGLCLSAGCAGLITGNPAVLSIQGVKAGPDTVTVSATLENVTNLLSISGQCTP